MPLNISRGGTSVRRVNHSSTQNMISRDYTKEVGIPSQKKTLPRPIAFVVLAIVAVGISFGVAGVVAESKEHGAEKSATRAAAKTPAAPTTPAAEAPAAK